MIYLLAAALLLATATLVLWIQQLRERARQRLIKRLLDDSDDFETLLYATRDKMKAMKEVVHRVPSDIGAVAEASLDVTAPVQLALRNLLEHRLWIARNANNATRAELVAALTALQRSREQIAARLNQLENAGAELAEATRGVVEQQAREPAALRRTEGSNEE